MSDQDTKQAIKEAAKEWLDQQMATIGRFTVKTLAGIVLVGLIYFAIKYGK